MHNWITSEEEEKAKPRGKFCQVAGKDDCNHRKELVGEDESERKMC